MNKPIIPAITESVAVPKAPPLQLVMIQANPTVGAIQQNLEAILEHRRVHADADLIVLSECFLTGYPLQDLVSLPHFIGAVARAVNELQLAVRNEPGPAVLFGAPTPGADKPYNSAILIRADGTLAMTHKQELPNNDVFDEMRNFAQGTGKAQPLRLNEQWSLGVMICEDGWHKKVASELEGEGANLLISINGSPVRLGKQQQRLLQMRRRAEETKLPVVYVNQVGGQDELVFDGSSFALNANGEILTQLAFMAEDSATLTVTPDERGHVQLERPHAFPLRIPTPCDTELMYRAGVLGLRDYVEKNKIPFVHLGISGGRDSAAVATMAADAIGAERVLGYRLPSAITGEESMDLAEELMARLGCKLQTVQIGGAVEEVLRATAQLTPRNDAAANLSRENLQARLRMVMLMYANNAIGGMLLGTSNKSESSVGYTTIYGDMAGQYNPIKDLFQTDVRRAIEWRNEHIPADNRNPIANPVPLGIVTRAPTAELSEGQTDEATLGSYETHLDPHLKGMVELQLDAMATRRKVEREGGIPIDPDYSYRVSDMVYAAEFKRRQACIGPQIRPNSFGLARRYPITNQFREMRPA